MTERTGRRPFRTVSPWRDRDEDGRSENQGRGVVMTHAIQHAPEEARQHGQAFPHGANDGNAACDGG